MKIELTQTAHWLDSDLETVISLFLNRINNNAGILLESAEIDGKWGRYSLAAGNFLLIAKSVNGLLKLEINDKRLVDLKKYENLKYLDGLKKIINKIHINFKENKFPPITRALYGYLTNNATTSFDEKNETNFEKIESTFCLPGNVYLFDHTYNSLVKLSLIANEKENKDFYISQDIYLENRNINFTKEEYIAKAQEMIDLIKQGNALELSFSQQASAEFKGDLFKIYRYLRKLSPSSYMFFLRLKNFSMAVASPKTMISCTNNKLQLCPIAGTRPRGKNLKEDNLFEEEIYSDKKELAEHNLMVDQGRNDLSKISISGTVQINRYMEVEKSSQTMQLASYINASLKENYDVIDVVLNTFPSSALSGCPKAEAMQISNKYENNLRGPYGGALGWLGLDKDSVNLDLGITIKGTWVKNNKIYWQAGVSLTHNANPTIKYQETLNKLNLIEKAIKEAKTNTI